jgi:hypothetical protein
MGSEQEWGYTQERRRNNEGIDFFGGLSDRNPGFIRFPFSRYMA